MLRWNAFLECVLVVAVLVGSALAGVKDGADAKTSAENAASAAEPAAGVPPGVTENRRLRCLSVLRSTKR